MIPNYFSKFVLLLLTSVMICACESHEKKADAYVRSKYSIKVSKGENKQIKEKITPIAYLKKKSVKRIAPNEWQQFKIDMEKKISANDQKIKSIKLNSTTTQKMIRQLNNLEEANNDLKIQLAIFNEEVIVKWQNFKTAMNHNVKKIGIEVEDISMK